MKRMQSARLASGSSWALDRSLLQGGADQISKINPGNATVQCAQPHTRSIATASKADSDANDSSSTMLPSACLMSALAVQVDAHAHHQAINITAHQALWPASHVRMRRLTSSGRSCCTKWEQSSSTCSSKSDTYFSVPCMQLQNFERRLLWDSKLLTVEVNRPGTICHTRMPGDG